MEIRQASKLDSWIYAGKKKSICHNGCTTAIANAGYAENDGLIDGQAEMKIGWEEMKTEFKTRQKNKQN